MLKHIVFPLARLQRMGDRLAVCVRACMCLFNSHHVAAEVILRGYAG